MLRIDVAVEQAHGDGLVCTAGQGALEGGQGPGLVQGLHHGAVGGHPLGDLDDVAPRHHRLGLAVEQLVDVAAVVALQLQQIAEAAGDQQADACALALQDGVGRHGGAVHQVAHGAGVEAGGIQRRQRAALGGGRGARHLLDADPVAVDEHQIRERPPDLDPDPHACPRRPRLPEE